ncbi:MAG TPA: RluA family pseudouridine synthase [Rhodospirillaceae bacterium]|nr:RNA pseudouridine synthase [Magnetovibrio sp.]HBT44016.1 RluA family pseudouridine synthase [Rhodospirillaceae bacterium]HCS71397.1 RluA family pseudouridine synthase [Rhodospirillaceae bacterium]
MADTPPPDAKGQTVSADEDGLRLDRWLKQHLPDLPFGQVQKLLRTGQIRIDGHRAKTGTRLEAGQEVRLPPSLRPGGEGVRNRALTATKPAPKPAPKISAGEIKDLQARVIYRDDEILVLDKPAGLAVQGGSGLSNHLDAMLDGLRFDAAERPRLTHRLDKDTSGVLVLARTRAAARWVTEGFRRKTIRKLYWAAVAGVPEIAQGRIRLKLGKKRGAGGQEKMDAEAEDAKRAETLYRIVDRVGRKAAAWLAMEPVTGRTHQLRAHALAMETPILGDGKYGGAEAFPDLPVKIRMLHLHARRIVIKHPSGRLIDVVAPLPPHMAETWKALGFTKDQSADELFDE